MIASVSTAMSDDRNTRWLVLLSLALNLFFVGIAGALAVRHYTEAPAAGTALVDRSAAARIERLAAAAPRGVRLRQHGDLHLGQVLRSDGQWLIFDFEGEPARTLAARREKHCPYKDVAGMLRSFAYAAAAAEKKGAVPADRRGPARKAFLEGYRSRARALLPDDPATGQALLASLELEKLLYELRYEVGHRPDWVEIPARDLLREEP